MNLQNKGNLGKTDILMEKKIGTALFPWKADSEMELSVQDVY